MKYIISQTLYEKKKKQELSYSDFFNLLLQAELKNNLSDIKSKIDSFFSNKNINKKFKYGISEGTMLINAVYYDFKYIVKILIESNAALNIEDKYGKTALYYAIENRNVEIVKILLETNKISLNKKFKKPSYVSSKTNKRYFSYLDLIITSIYERNVERKIFNLLMKYNYKINYDELSKIVYNFFYLKNSINNIDKKTLNHIDKNGRNLLFLPISYSAIKLLLQYGINPNHEVNNKNFLQYAFNDNMEIIIFIKKLLKDKFLYPKITILFLEKQLEKYERLNNLNNFNI